MKCTHTVLHRYNNILLFTEYLEYFVPTETSFGTSISTDTNNTSHKDSSVHTFTGPEKNQVLQQPTIEDEENTSKTSSEEIHLRTNPNDSTSICNTKDTVSEKIANSKVKGVNNTVSTCKSNTKTSKETAINGPMELNSQTYKYSDMYCREVSDPSEKNKESTFYTYDKSKEKENLGYDGGRNVHASEYVEFLDSLPFDDDEFDEDEIDYYDKVLNI